MKKLLNKNSIFCFILGGLIFGSIGIYAASMYNSNDITYSNKNFGVTNVKDALDNLYGICGEYKVQLQYRIENKTYEIGESVNWAGQNWYAINNDSNSVTLILKSNYATGAYGSNTTFEGSTAFDKVNVDFVNNNGQIIDAINSGAVVQQGNYNNEPYYVRLPEQTELSSLIPNSSNTSFWTKTVNESGLYFGSSNGEEGKLYSVGYTTSYRGQMGQCYDSSKCPTCPTHCSNSGLVVSLATILNSKSYLEPHLETVIDSYTSATEYSSSAVASTGSGCLYFNMCDSGGVLSNVYTCNDSYRLYASPSGCTAKTVYYLSEAKTIGYRPVVTVYKK